MKIINYTKGIKENLSLFLFLIYVMRKIILIFIAFCTLSACSDKESEEAEKKKKEIVLQKLEIDRNLIVYTVKVDGHKLVISTTGYAEGGTSTVHSPGCDCFKKK